MNELPPYHLVLVTTSYPQNGNGSEAAGSFVGDLVVALSQHMCVSVVAPAEESEVHLGDKIDIHYFGVPRQPLSLLKPWRLQDWFAIWQTMSRGMGATKKLVHQERVDHILALWVLPSGFWAMRAAQKAGVGYSVWGLGSDIWTLGKLPFVRRILAQVMRKSRYCYADGYQLAEDMRQISGRSCEFLSSSRRLLGVEPQLLKAAPPYRLAFLGRWHPNKGIDILLESLKLLNEDDWACIEEIHIAGGGPLEDKVRSGCDELNANMHPVKLSGYLNKQEAIAFFHDADCVLIPSRIESIPVIFSDAMKCRCPVVCMPVGDMPRLLSEYQVGVLADAVSPEAFSLAIRSILSNSMSVYEADMVRASNQFSVEHTVQTILASLGIAGSE